MIAIARAARAGPGGASSTIGAKSVWFSGAKPAAGARDDARAGPVSGVFDPRDTARDGAAGRDRTMSAGGPAALAFAPIVIRIAPSAAIIGVKRVQIDRRDWRIV